jgi:hypothetical protein
MLIARWGLPARGMKWSAAPHISKGSWQACCIVNRYGLLNLWFLWYSFFWSHSGDWRTLKKVGGVGCLQNLSFFFFLISGVTFSKYIESKSHNVMSLPNWPQNRVWYSAAVPNIVMNLGFHEKWEVFWVAEKLSIF